METSDTDPSKTAVWDGRSSIVGDMQSCYHLTQQLFHHVQTKPLRTQREEWIQNLLVLLDQREQVLKSLNPPFTAEEETLGKQIMEWNQAIQQALKEIQLEIKRSIQGIHNKKQNIQKYIHPYGSLPIDGVFYDKRK